MSDKDIVYLETRVERWRGRWRAMNRTARIGIVSIIFGAIGLLTCWLMSFLPFLSIPFSVIGLALGFISTLAGFYMDRRRDAFWFPLIGLILSLLGLAFGLGNWFNYQQNSRDQAAKNAQLQAQAAREKLLGRWEPVRRSEGTSIEFTSAGSFVLSRLSPSGDDSEKLVETVGKYQIKESTISIGFAQHRQPIRAMSYEYDYNADDELLLRTRTGSAGQGLDFSGRWRRIGPPRAMTETEREIAEYKQQLEKCQIQNQHIADLLEKFANQRNELLQKLKSYEAAATKDDRWYVYARELDTLVNQIELVESRQPMLKQAIVRLEAAISNRTRKAELEALGLTNARLEEIMLTSDRLADELKSAKGSEFVEKVALEDVVQRELKKEDENQE